MSKTNLVLNVFRVAGWAVVASSLFGLSVLAANEPLFDVKKDGPLLTEPRKVTVQTSAGQLTFILIPQWAPQTVTQMAKLFRYHAFDGTEIARYEPGFVFQISPAESKAPGRMPLPLSTRNLIRRIPLEVDLQQSGKVKHQLGALSMAHYDNDPSSNTTSFSILLGNAPHLDKKYTIFGMLAPEKENQKTLANMKAQWPKHPYIIKTVTTSK